MSAQPPTHADWIDAFLAWYHARHPVNATFIGVRDFDDRLPDLSENGLGDALSEVETLLRDEASARDPQKPAEAIDRRLAKGFLAVRAWELTSRHTWRGNPALYTGEAIFGLMALFLPGAAPTPTRVEAATARMRAIPELLAQGRENVRGAPAPWTRRALRECQGAAELFGDGIAALRSELGIGDPRFAEAAERAARAFAEHARALRAGLADGADTPAGCGAEALEAHLRHVHFLSEGAREIAGYAEEELASAEARLEAGAPDFGASTPDEALAGLRAAHPSAGGYYARYREIWDEMRGAAEARGLVTWPDDPIRYVPRPAWTRGAAPYLYFLFYRSPAAENRPAVHDYLVAPLPEGDPTDFLRAHHDAVIKLNHVLHHGGLGHHVQNGHAARAESRIGRIAAIDCAARIAMGCGGTMAEGWACYATDLAGEAGMLTPLETYAELHGRVRMAARAVVDVRLHLGEITLDEAAAFYAARAGMSPDAARAEAVKTSMFPGGALMYLVGTDAIHRLRAEMALRAGADFDLRAFHDALLSYGSVPISLIAEQMTNGAAAAPALAADAGRDAE